MSGANLEMSISDKRKLGDIKSDVCESRDHNKKKLKISDELVQKEHGFYDSEASNKAFNALPSLLKSISKPDCKFPEECYKNVDPFEIQLSDLEDMLDADLPDEYKKPMTGGFIQRLNERKKQAGDFDEASKTVIDGVGGDHFDLLPVGWIQMMHRTGIPVYLFRSSRVCTLARPYFLGSGNIWNHRIPVSAIPCLQYRKAFENNIGKTTNFKEEDHTRVIRNLRVPITKIETVYENEQTQSLGAEEVQSYCKKMFPYKKVFIKRDKELKNRMFSSNDSSQNFKNRPSLPAETKLLSFMIFERDPKGEVVRSREWIMNPNGKSYIAILHEYLQQALKIQPLYDFKNNENGYDASVKLKDVLYGQGTGSSKKDAKLLAAKHTLEILIPELNGRAEEICNANIKKQEIEEPVLESNNIFEEIKITDPRIAEFCARTTEPSPYAMLLTCLRRNYGTVDVETHYDICTKYNKSNKFTMTVGKHTVTVLCRNKREGKQKAAQEILQALHPQLRVWGSLVRLYGNRSVKNAKEKKMEEQEITQLQTQAKRHSPNYAILDKLNMELEKLYRKKMEMKPVGKLVTTDMPKNSVANLNTLNYS